jgi:hypothetical protein
MLTRRHVALHLSVTLLTLLALERRAHAGPAIDYRMSISDRSTASFVQPLVWMKDTNDGLTAKYGDQSTWLRFNSFLVSGPEAVSWTDGVVQRQRVFFVQSGRVQMLTFDDNILGSQVALPAVPGKSFDGNDIAAALWSNGGTNTVTVVAAAFDGVSTTRHVCAYEAPVTSFAWTVWCSASPAIGMPHDIVKLSSPLRFLFRNNNSGLSSIIKTGGGPGQYGLQTVLIPSGVTSIRPSLSVYPDSSGKHQIALIANTGRVWAASFDPTATFALWTQLPALPGSVSPTSQVGALDGAPYNPPAPMFDRMLQVVGTDGRLYRIIRSSSTWPSSWETLPLPGGLQYTKSIGATYGDGQFSFPKTFLAGGDTSYPVVHGLSHRSTTYYDHVESRVGRNLALAGPANESAVGFTANYGAAVAIQRNNPPPWRTLISGTSSGGNAWGSTLLVNQRAPYNAGYVRGSSDPVVVGGAGSYLHYVDIELESNGSCVRSEDANPPPPIPSSNDINYRRAQSANGIATMSRSSADFFSIAAAQELDHPFIGLTGDIYSSTLHSSVWIQYWDIGAGTIRQWSLTPGGIRTVNVGSVLGSGPPIVFTGASAYSSSLGGANFQKICQLVEGNLPTVCGTPSGTPVPEESRLISFGAPLSSAAGACPSRSDGTSTRFYDCFDTHQAISYASDPRATTPSVFLAYHAIDTSAAIGADGMRPLSVYFTRNTNGSLSSWSTPVRIHGRVGQEDYFDPEISVDGSGTIVVTYSTMTRAPILTNSTRADVKARWSTVANSSTWNQAQGNAFQGDSYGVWFASSLPTHCGRRLRFLGEYRNPARVGGRVQHVFPSSASTAVPTNATSQWFSLDTIR